MYDLHIYKVIFKSTKRGQKKYFLKVQLVENIKESMLLEKESFYKKCYGWDTVINFVKHGEKDWIIDNKKVILNINEINR